MNKPIHVKVHKLRFPQAICSIADKIQESQWGQRVCRLVEMCNANPFPAQMILIFLYRLSLDALYILTISPSYSYQAFTTDLVPWRYAVSFLGLLPFIPFVARYNSFKTISSTIVTLLNYIYFIPLTSFVGCKGTSMSFFVVALVYWALLLLFQWKIPILHLKPLSHQYSRKFFLVVTVFSILFVMFISGKYTGFRFTLNFIDVYGIRAESASYQIPTIAEYLLSSMPIIFAFLLIYWLRQKKYAVCGVLCVVFVFLFSISAHKSQFLFFFLTLFCFFLFREWMYRWISGFLLLASLLAILADKLLGMIHLAALFFLRMMYTPVWLAEYYMDFFQSEPLNLFRNGIMGRFSFSNIYSDTIANVIGEFNGTGYVANTGMLGDLFANLPTAIGIFLLPLILILCLRLLDMVSSKISIGLFFTIALLYASNFANGSWSNVLLTNGMLLTCVLFYIFPKEALKK